ncbi:MAG: hypothetical protein V3S41_05435 [Spirochaetia bacterium]
MKGSTLFRGPTALIFGLVALLSTADTAELNRDLASLYVDAVENASIDLEQALALIESALEFDPASSDALFLRGYLQRGIQERTVPVISDFELALRNDNFASFDRNQAIVAYAEVLLRTRRPEDALSMLDGADLTAPDLDLGLVADALAVEAGASTQADDGARANRAVADGRRQFPDDMRFFLLELESEPSPSFRYRRVLNRLLRAGADGRSMQATLLRYALTAPIASERTWGFETYLEMGGQDPAIILAVAASGDRDIVDTFVRLNGYGRRDALVNVIEAVGAGDTLDALLDGAGRFSGISHSDGDGDEFWEERVTVVNGFVLRWEIDADQNGINEVDVVLSNGEPVRLTVEQPAGMVVADYEAYPFVKSVEIPFEGGSSRYNLLPFAIRAPILRELPVGGPRLESSLELPGGFVGLDLSAVRLAADSVQMRDPEDRVVEERILEDGIIVRSSRDTNRDGAMDHLVVYRSGLPVTGLRDIDGDGYFEVAEAYVDGIVSMMIVDEDDNGTPDVTEYAREGGEREWDLDQDGVIDVREFGIWTDSVRREFPFLENSR